MNRRRTLIVAGAVATAIAGGAGAGVAVAASSTTTHTLKFDSVQTGQKAFGKKFVSSDKDVKGKKNIGFDVLVGTVHASSEKSTVSFSAGLKGGFLYAHGTGSFKTGDFTGKVTGGTGKYQGITGTIKGTSFGKHHDNEHLTIAYH